MARGSSISAMVAAGVGLGAIIGAGIFVLSGTAIALAGLDALFAFIAVGIVAIFVALQTGEMASIFPHVKGTIYSFVYNAFGSQLGFMTGVVIYTSYVTSVSAISLGFGSYLSSVLALGSAWDPIYFAIALIIALSLVNLHGIKSAVEVDFGLVLVKVLILLVFIIFGLSYLTSVNGGPPYAHFSVSAAQSGVLPFFQACVVIFFAYSGFQVINTFTDRIKGGPRAAAKAIIGAVVVSIALYVLVVFALMLLVPAGGFTVSADPLASALKAVHAPGYLFYIVDIGALIATASAALAGLLSSSRILYQISKDNLLPSIFYRAYDPRRDVASYAILLSMVISIATLFLGNVYVIAAMADFGIIFSYIALGFALIHFRRIGKRGSFSAPFYPYLPILSIVILIAFMYGMPQQSLFIGFVILFLSMLVYFSLREIEEKKVVKVKLFD
ncbi:MAG: amino acid permease [Candidatus Micrarchaeota archaeon]|nr:amino acid permease [Candidatus Micrarchaeota archaeon]